MKQLLLLSILAVLAVYGCTESETSTPEVITGSFISITPETVIIAGEVSNDGGKRVSARGVCWDTTPTPAILHSDFSIDGTGAGSFTSSIENLEENTTYFIRAYATNDIGTAYGEEISFHTGAGILDQSQTDMSYGFAVSQNEERWQIFKPMLNNISTVEVFIGTVDPTGKCTMKVQSRSGDSTYVEQIFDASMLPEFDWFKMDLFSVPVTTESRFRISMTRSVVHSPQNAIYWRGNQQSNYPENSDVHPGWTSYDYAFKTYGF